MKDVSKEICLKRIELTNNKRNRVFSRFLKHEGWHEDGYL